MSALEDALAEIERLREQLARAKMEVEAGIVEFVAKTRLQLERVCDEARRPKLYEHELKTWPGFFDKVVSGQKTFEVRLDDRGGFLRGQMVLLREFEPKSCEYSGRWLLCEITYVLPDPFQFGVAADYAVFGIRVLAESNHASGGLW